MNKFKNEEEYVIGKIGGEKSKKQTLASLFSDKKDSEIPSELNSNLVITPQKSKYTLSSVFPNEKIQDEVFEVLDQMEKEKYYERLGIPLDSQEDVSWERLIELDEEMRREQKPKRGKFLSKIIKRRGV